MNNRRLLLLGNPSHLNMADIAGAARRMGIHVEAVSDRAGALEWLDHNQPAAIVAETEASEVASAVFAIRARPKLSNVPIVGAVKNVSDLAFLELFEWGGDDLVELGDTAALSRRLQMLPKQDGTAGARPKGTVLVADADVRRRVLSTRCLRNAGFEVKVASNTDELAQAWSDPAVVAVMADAEVPETGAEAALKAARSGGNAVPWVISAAPRKMGALALAAQGVEGVMLHDAFAPVENALFCINESLFGFHAEQRASPRLLYGTVVNFRVAGRDSDEFGYVYNVSADGLYIRTMAPLDVGEDAWLELKPPRTERRVRLEGKVAWRRMFGPLQGATVPPGFGVRITGGSTTDTQRYREGYEAFRKDLEAVRTSLAPKGRGCRVEVSMPGRIQL